MQVCQMETLQSMPTLGALVGTVTSAPIIENFNKQWGNDHAVIFGQTGDPFKERYLHLTSVLNNVIIPTQNRVLELEIEASTPVFKAIECENDLRNISDNMKVPILLHEPVRSLFVQDKIYGFGYDKKYLPDEDVYGRLIENGTGNFNSKEIPEYITALFMSTDPDLSDEAIDAIMESRKFVDQWLAEQMGPDGKMIDPTDMDNVIRKR